MHITAEAAARFPSLSAYDHRSHRYARSYVEPEGWDLELTATDVGLILTGHDRLFADPDDDGDGRPGSRYKPVVLPIYSFPDDVAAIEWEVRSTTPTIRYSHTVRDSPGQRYDPLLTRIFAVPAPGQYSATITIHHRNGSRHQASTRYAFRDYLVVSVGDSYASGEGNPTTQGKPSFTGRMVCEATTLARAGALPKPAMDRRATWVEPLADRSYRSGPALAARRLDDGKDGTVVSFLSFASSGAEIRDGLLGPQKSWQQPLGGQLDEVRWNAGARRVDALLLSIGGNDVGFSGYLEDMTADWFFGKNITDAEIDERIRALETDLDQLREAITERVDPRAVYITEYPTALFDRTEKGPGGETRVVVKGGCGIFDSMFDIDISDSDARSIKRAGQRLNQCLATKARDFGWIHVDGIDELFAGRGYCSGSSMFRFAEDSCKQQGDFDGTMHPNAEGVAAIARCLVSALARHTIRRPVILTADDQVIEGEYAREHIGP